MELLFWGTPVLRFRLEKFWLVSLLIRQLLLVRVVTWAVIGNIVSGFEVFRDASKLSNFS